MVAKSIIDKDAKIVLQWVLEYEAIIENKEVDTLTKLVTTLDLSYNTLLSFTLY